VVDRISDLFPVAPASEVGIVPGYPGVAHCGLLMHVSCQRKKTFKNSAKYRK